MKITIAGSGRVGSHLAKYLSTENQDIYIIDADEAALLALDMDFNLLSVHGNPTELDILKRAQANVSDMFIAVTPVTSDNIVACSMAKSMGSRLTVARVDRPDYVRSDNLELLKRMGVDRVIFPELLASDVIIDALRHPWTRYWYEFPDADIIMLGVRVDDNAPMIGKCLYEFAEYSHIMHISAIRRNHATIIPNGSTQVCRKDVLYITTKVADLSTVMYLTGKRHEAIRNVLICGGGKLARTFVDTAHSEFNITIMEPDESVCRQLSRSCSTCRIIHGDPSEDEALIEAGLFEADAFMALTDRDASNILSCMTASDAGVKKTVVEIERDQFINKAEAFSISTIINKQYIASGAIFQLMLDADVSSSKCLVLSDAEVGRLTVKEGSPLVKAPVKDLKLPGELTLAGMIRGGAGQLVTGSTRLRTGDNVIVFCLRGALHKVEKLFS